jgi:uncharacterized SAM-binding protein YcdF (DUF218 family)
VVFGLAEPAAANPVNPGHCHAAWTASVQYPMTKRKIWLLFFICILLLAGSSILLHGSGTFLVRDNPARSDIIVVLAGDIGDVRFQHGLSLLRKGYSQELILDAPNWNEYGRTSSDLAREYIKSIAPDKTAQLHVCSFNGDSTVLELHEVGKCIHTIAPRAQTAILVTSNFHTRRALSVAQHTLPEYRWSVASAPDELFGTAWWQHREWAKTALSEWQKLCWWTLIDQFKTP